MKLFGGPCFCLAMAVTMSQAAWPNTPFVTSGRWISNTNGSSVQFAGVNWVASANSMVPEGLQYQSVEGIVSKIKSLGMNVIRLTYAIEMIDQIFDNGGADITLQTAFARSLGPENGTAVYNKIMANNPSFGSGATRLQVFDAIAAECARQEIYIHLDNHVSKAGWCCTPLDGNTWWGDTYFSVSNWTRGLSYMAEHVCFYPRNITRYLLIIDKGKQWGNLVSMSLRNELRQPLLNSTLFTESYNWKDWYSYSKQGADAINRANPNLLIFLSGLDSGTSLTPVAQGTALTPGTATFSSEDFQPYSNKLVLELHNYANILGAPNNCSLLEADLFQDGFQALSDNATTRFPVVMSEFGFVQDATTWKSVFASCLESYLQSQRAGWMIWALGGSYYIRENKQDYDETWGLLNHDWSDWRSSEHINGGLIPLIKATKAASVNLQATGGSNNTADSRNSTSGDAKSSARLHIVVDQETWTVALICLLMVVPSLPLINLRV